MRKAGRFTAVSAFAAVLLAGCGAAAGSSGQSDETTSPFAMTTPEVQEDPQMTESAQQSSATAAQVSVQLLESAEDIALTDEGGDRFTFTYGGEEFEAIYTPDNWKIMYSYKIRNKADMTIICKALLDVHPVHGRDYESFRTPEDCAYEWEQHNTAYDMLPETSPYKANTRDVDLNPEDQGKSFIEMAGDRLRREE